jgi:hypothetical protein
VAALDAGMSFATKRASRWSRAAAPSSAMLRTGALNPSPIASATAHRNPLLGRAVQRRAGAAFSAGLKRGR